jgi:hypothetical protein
VGRRGHKPLARSGDVDAKTMFMLTLLLGLIVFIPDGEPFNNLGDLVVIRSQYFGSLWKALNT